MALGLSLVAILGLHLFYLDSQIRSRFEAHRWNLPSRVYSEPFYLYPGQVIALNAVEQRLERLAYKRVAADPKSIGEFTRNKSTLVVYLHDFAYPAGPFSGFPVKISFENDQITQINRYEPQEEIKTLKLEPELLASLFDDKMEDRTLVTIAEIPEDLLHGVVAIEDERFYSHHGIDPLAILRAFLTDLLHLRAVQGGSTLTQQLIKNYFLSSEKTLGRKLNELLMAILLEFRYSKEAILEAYLNEIYFGQKGPVSVTGVQEASRFYFSKDVSYLTPAECALLAGMIRSPGEYSPLKNISKAYDRRNFVLKSMREKDFLPEEEYQKARKEKILVSPDHRKSFQAPYFVDFVQSKLHSDYPENVLRSEGLRIFTTLNPDAQEVAEDAMKHRLSELEEGRPKLKKLRADGKFLEGALIAIKPQTGAIVAFVGGRDYGVSQFDRIPDAHRQPGSSFKPFVYLAALSEMGEKKYTLASTLEDVAYTTRAGDKDWKPENYDHMEHGTVTLREALEQSYNIATSRLGLDVGLDKIIRLAQEAGIESPLEPFPALSLGASELTPL
ncbi:MAG: transglycosylase domain-containing protein, partial [Deltaproteobacteria bacterium]|nr:transglycosylase domain-containing protein [Deltaproteobacteria bacterium]